MLSANILVSTTNLGVKQMSSFSNKFFKMSDQFLMEWNNNNKGKPAVPRNYINTTFDSFRRKREAA